MEFSSFAVEVALVAVLLLVDEDADAEADAVAEVVADDVADSVADVVVGAVVVVDAEDEAALVVEEAGSGSSASLPQALSVNATAAAVAGMVRCRFSTVLMLRLSLIHI